MSKRPLPVIVVGIVYICAGIAGVIFHFGELKAHSLEWDAALAVLARLTAIVCGAFLLAGKNWARWFAVAWIGFHVVLSAFHSIPELAMHAVLLVVITYFLFCPSAARYFRDGTSSEIGHETQ